MKAKDIMHRGVVTVMPLATLSELSDILSKHKISGVPVVDNRGNLMGVVSQTDIVRRGKRNPEDLPDYYKDVLPLFGAVKRELEEETVFNLMTPAVLSADEETPVIDLARQMLARHIHRIPITKEKRLTGIVSTMDLVRAFLELAEAQDNTLKS